MRGKLMTALTILIATTWAQGQSSPATASKPAQTDKAAVVKAAAPSLVKVEITLQTDKGENPVGHGWGFSDIGQESIQEERPAEAGGFLVAPDKVVVVDPMLHERFIKGIAVRFGDQTVPAKPFAYARDQSAMVLELAEPLKDAKPLAFDAAAKGPYQVVTYRREDGLWTIGAEGASGNVSKSEDGLTYFSLPVDCLVTTEKGVPVALCMTDKLPLDDSWKGSPLAWPMISSAERRKLMDATGAKSDQCVLRVKINFRSPKKGGRIGGFMPEGSASATELYTLGVLLDKDLILVLANLKPAITARLERVLVYPPKGEPVPAEFVATLKDYGAFLARLEKPMAGPADSAPADLSGLYCRLLPAVQVYLRGEQRQCYVDHRRIAGFDVGWKRHLYPKLSGDDRNTFLFDEQCRLAALPISRREKVGADKGYSYGNDNNDLFTDFQCVRDLCADLAKNTDPSNTPLTEEQENRLAWLGVELQPLDRELARVNGVSDQTQDGQTGALVSYVYPGSPADQAGIKPGNVLLRLCSPDLPKPVEVTVSEYGFADRPFPWDRLDDVPERYFEHIPPPWPQTDNSLNRTLTDLGFDKKFTAEFFIDGQSVKKDFQVVQSPPHYNTAPRHKSASTGLTVRDMTYEVRRYFQKSDQDPGVIVSKIEPGSKASVAGVKPYEIITHVNDQPVANVKDFEKLVNARPEDELRLSVLRMTQGRIVKIKPGPPASQPATAATNEAEEANE